MKDFAKRILCIAIAAVMVLSLCACGDKEDTEPAAATAAPEYVYASEFTTVEDKFTGYPNTSAFTDTGFYTMVNEYVRDDIPEGAVPEFEGQYAVYENVLYFVGFDGSVRKLEAYKPIDIEKTHENSQSWIGFNGMYALADGTLLSVNSFEEYWSDAPDGVEMYSDEWYNYYNYVTDYYIVHMNSDGSIIGEPKKLEKVENDTGDFYIYSIVADDNGVIYANYDQAVFAYDTDGNNLFTLSFPNWVDNLVKMSDGRVGAMVWGDEGSYKLYAIDPETKSFGESYELPSDAWSCYPGSGEYTIYYTSGSSLYGFNAATGESDKLLNWINCDVNNYEISGFTVRDSGEIYVINSAWNSKTQNYNCEIGKIVKVPYDPSNEKTVLKLATLSLGYDVRDAIIRFNRTNPNYRIEIADYSEYNDYSTEDGGNAGLTKLNTEILAGNLPDLLDMSSLPFSRYATKGILVDLYPYMDADSELSRDDFIPNALKLGELNGELLTSISGFAIQTVAGASSVVGTEPGWTYDEFNAALASMPEGCTPFDEYTTRDTVLYYCLCFQMNDFIDWSTGNCSFDSQEFIDLLKFVARFPEEYDWDNYDWNSTSENRLSSGQQMLLNVYLSSFDDMFYQGNSFGTDVTYIGWPTSGGTGSYLTPTYGSAFSITTACKDKDAAWQFIRQFFTEEYQEDMYYFPSNINAFNKLKEDAMTPVYQQDANGNYLLDENGERIMIPKFSYWNEDGTQTPFYCLSEEQVAKIIQLIETTDKAYEYDESIINIVTEQSAAFFSGQKSAEETARLVQSKAKIYVNEQR